MRSAATCIAIVLALTLGGVGRTEDRAEPPPSASGTERKDAEKKEAETGNGQGTEKEVEKIRIYIPPSRGAKKA